MQQAHRNRITKNNNLGTFGNNIPLPFCELMTRTSNSRASSEEVGVAILYLYGIHLHNRIDE